LNKRGKMEIWGLDVLKSAMIIIVILLYWKFVYYKYHKKAITPILFFLAGGISFFIGIYTLINHRVSFEDIKYVYYALMVFALFSFASVIYAVSKHGLNNDVDITLTWCKNVFPFVPYYFWMVVAIFPSFFFITFTTYYALGNEHVVLWAMIFIAWIRSNVRLYRKEVLK